MSATRLASQILATQAASLKGYYKCDEASGNLADSSGNSKTLTAGGSSTYSVAGAPAGNAITFSGSSDFTRTDAIIGTTAPSEWCMMGLVKWSSPSTLRYVFAMGGSSSNAILGWGSGYGTASKGEGSVLPDSGGNGNWGFITGEEYAGVFDGNWHTVILYRRNGTYYFRLDGVVIGSKTGTQGTVTLNRTSVGGLLRSSASNRYGGSAQHIACWSACPTDAQIERIEASVAMLDTVPENWPTITAADAINSTNVTVTWTYTQGAHPETGFTIEKSTDGTTWTSGTTAAAGATSATVGGLSAATDYYFRVRATNAAGDGLNSDPLTARTWFASEGVSGLVTKVSNYAFPTSTGSQAITGVGFKPKLLIGFSPVTDSDPPTTQGVCRIGFGVSTRAIEQAAVSTYSDNDTSATGIMSARPFYGELCDAFVSTITQHFNDGVTQRAYVTSMDSDGWTQDVTDISGYAHLHCYIALGGDDIKVVQSISGGISSPTSTGDQSYTLPFSDPDLIILLCAGTTGFSTTISASPSASIGFIAPQAESGKQQGAIGWSGTNASNPTVNHAIYDSGRCLASTAAGAVSYGASLVSCSGRTLTLNWDTAAGTAYKVAVVAVKGGQYAVCPETQKTSTGTKTTSVGFTPSAVLFTGISSATAASAVSGANVVIGTTNGTTQQAAWWGHTHNVATPDTWCAYKTTKTILHYAVGTPTLNAEASATFGSSDLTLDWTTADATARRFFAVVLGNALPPDVTAPTLSSATVASNGTTLNLVFDEAVVSVSASDYALSGHTLSSATGSGANWSMTISAAVTDAETVTLSYSGTATQDTSGNLLATFSGRSVTNSSGIDGTAPSVPANLSAKRGDTIAYLTWSAATGGDVAGYKLRRDGSVIYNGSSLLYLDTGLTNGTTYSYTIAAYDEVPNESAESSALSVTPGASGGSLFFSGVLQIH